MFSQKKINLQIPLDNAWMKIPGSSYLDEGWFNASAPVKLIIPRATKYTIEPNVNQEQLVFIAKHLAVKYFVKLLFVLYNRLLK